MSKTESIIIKYKTKKALKEKPFLAVFPIFLFECMAFPPFFLSFEFYDSLNILKSSLVCLALCKILILIEDISLNQYSIKPKPTFFIFLVEPQESQKSLNIKKMR